MRSLHVGRDDMGWLRWGMRSLHVGRDDMGLLRGYARHDMGWLGRHDMGCRG